MVSQEDHQQNCRIGQCLTRAFPRVFGLLYFVSANLFTFTLSVQLPDGHFAMNTSDQESFALNEIRSSHQSGDGITSEIEQPTLPPADDGRAAWLMLASCCLIQLPVWGMLCIQNSDWSSLTEISQGSPPSLEFSRNITPLTMSSRATSVTWPPWELRQLYD